MKTISIQTSDGHRLNATLYEPLPSLGAPSKAVLVVCAMGVPQRFYRALCEWLSDRGCLAMTFDYRGMGLSRQGSLRDLSADILTWAENDTAAALTHLAKLSGDTPITWLGHSLGGQIFAFALNAVSPDIAARVKRVSYLAAGSGYWRENAAPTKRRSWLFWFVLGPVLTPLFGYWPGAKLGIVGDLPRGVFT
ncbi:MAG: alpha/beta fold hydrolase [Betaproteobacteria bacterium]|nr:MAG: alpha/beta fold hydrolase [Betaproteobacteria bacterium]